MLYMGTLQHKQVKSQKKHLQILWGWESKGPRGRGLSAERRHMGLRAEKNKHPFFLKGGSPTLTSLRSSRLEVVYKKEFLEISQNSQEKTCARISFLIKFLKKRLWHRYFPVNFAKFLRTAFS